MAAAASSSSSSAPPAPMQTDSSSKETAAARPGLLPWVEKYRPKTLDDVRPLFHPPTHLTPPNPPSTHHPPTLILPTHPPHPSPKQVVGNAEAIDRLKVVAKDGNMPHMMLAGPPVSTSHPPTHPSTHPFSLSSTLPVLPIHPPTHPPTHSSDTGHGQDLLHHVPGPRATGRGTPRYVLHPPTHSQPTAAPHSNRLLILYTNSTHPPTHPNPEAAVLELNASDERGIDVIRSRIKMFAQKKVNLHPPTHPPTPPPPPCKAEQIYPPTHPTPSSQQLTQTASFFSIHPPTHPPTPPPTPQVVLPPGRHKVVILDEADSMTSAAQQALRRTMEIYSHTTRFALACNTSSKIIEPIQSRCAILRFSRLADEELLDRLRIICEAENVGFSNDGLEAVIFTAEGDMRNAINNLQSTYSGFGYINQVSPPPPLPPTHLPTPIDSGLLLSIYPPTHPPTPTRPMCSRCATNPIPS